MYTLKSGYYIFSFYYKTATENNTWMYYSKCSYLSDPNWFIKFYATYNDLLFKTRKPDANIIAAPSLVFKSQE